ncbi:hypothetical protein BEH94_01890 [Candidatus Altiarchaeales archaeon WOR_SM1_SCG]|nr:hypothetical protein BEH94_01890 [Candidatus Altiarchaeales archaeon WOR_SM1_SCG]
MNFRKIEEYIFKILMLTSLVIVTGSLTGIIAVVLIKGGAAISRDVLTTTPKGDFYMGGSVY